MERKACKLVSFSRAGHDDVVDFDIAPSSPSFFLVVVVLFQLYPPQWPRTKRGFRGRKSRTGSRSQEGGRQRRYLHRRRTTHSAMMINKLVAAAAHGGSSVVHNAHPICDSRPRRSLAWSTSSETRRRRRRRLTVIGNVFSMRPCFDDGLDLLSTHRQ
jgi:hypothetical protein